MGVGVFLRPMVLETEKVVPRTLSTQSAVTCTGHTHVQRLKFQVVNLGHKLTSHTEHNHSTLQVSTVISKRPVNMQTDLNQSCKEVPNFKLVSSPLAPLKPNSYKMSTLIY